MDMTIDREDCQYITADRGSGYQWGDEIIIGFDVAIGCVRQPNGMYGGGLRIQFEDERDAVRLAKEILSRLGELQPCKPSSQSSSYPSASAS